LKELKANNLSKKKSLGKKPETEEIKTGTL
jgi:hypothetical protein